MGTWAQEDPNMGTGPLIWGQGLSVCPYMGPGPPQKGAWTPLWGQGAPECPYMGTRGQKDPNMGT